MAIHLNKLESPLGRMLLPILVEISPKILIFSSFCYNSYWKRAWSFIWTNLNLLHLSACAKFGWNWPSISLNFLCVFLLFHYNLPLEKGMALNFNNFKFPSLKNFCLPSLVEIGPLLMEKMKIGNVYKLMDNMRSESEKLIWAFSSGELIKQVLFPTELECQ